MKRSGAIQAFSALAALALLAIALAALPAAEAGKTCPYTGAPLPTDYAEVTMLPVEKYVGKGVTISVVDISKEGNRQPASGRIIQIFYLINDEVASEYSLYTKSDGTAVFTPEDSGKYAVATSARYIFFNALSKCGDEVCSSDESRTSCPEDCSKCGDNVCDVNENKLTCAKDCVVCGDGTCDSGESRNSCPDDCARCGDGVCDLNENKLMCPNDCVVCGDGVCDQQELISLHQTSCPRDCVVCGDGFCDDCNETAVSCPQDCAECGNGLCEPGENVSCIRDCTVCGDGKCRGLENRTSCPKDCAECGDGFCDGSEIIALHETSCAADCTECGDGVCDEGESPECEDCKKTTEGIFLGYFMIPILIVIAIIIFELIRHRTPEPGRSMGEAAETWEGGAAAGGRKKAGVGRESMLRAIRMQKMEPMQVMPYLIVFAVSLMMSTMALSVMGLGYDKDLAVLDLGSYLLEKGGLISLVVIFVSAGAGMLSRATYFMERNQALALCTGFALLGMLPGLAIFQSFEYMLLMAGALLGTGLATISVKKEESELIVKKPFREGGKFADKMLTVAALFVCLAVFAQILISDDTADNFTKSVWGSHVTKSAIRDAYGPQADQSELKQNVIKPLLRAKVGGMDGKPLFALAITLVMFVLLKLFITLIKLLAGFFAWMLDRSGFV